MKLAQQAEAFGKVPSRADQKIAAPSDGAVRNSTVADDGRKTAARRIADRRSKPAPRLECEMAPTAVRIVAVVSSVAAASAILRRYRFHPAVYRRADIAAVDILTREGIEAAGRRGICSRMERGDRGLR